MPVSWTAPSTHSVWPVVLSVQPALYSGATAYGSAEGGGTVFGLLTFASPPQFPRFG